MWAAQLGDPPTTGTLSGPLQLCATCCFAVTYRVRYFESTPSPGAGRPRPEETAEDRRLHMWAGQLGGPPTTGTHSKHSLFAIYLAVSPRVSTMPVMSVPSSPGPIMNGGIV